MVRGIQAGGGDAPIAHEAHFEDLRGAPTRIAGQHEVDALEERSTVEVGGETPWRSVRRPVVPE